MADGCPSPQMLEAFSLGKLPPEEADPIAAHVGGCTDCQKSFLPLALKISSLGLTANHSPLASFRRHSREVPFELPGMETPSLSRRITDPEAPTPVSEDGLEDTHVSGENTDPGRTRSLTRGQTLDRYMVLERIGSGGMGEVYAAWDPALDRKVAVKLLRADYADSPIADELTLRLVREAQALARLSHPNVVTVHDVGTLGKQVFIAMEWAKGLTLSKWGKAKPRSWQQVLSVFLAAGEGLATAHASGLTHRDFKPDNVIVDGNGRPRVMDFGLVHARAEVEKEVEREKSKDSRDPKDSFAPLTESSGAMKRAITQPGVMLGTPAYMPPEALHGQPTDFRSDIFSYCVALYEALYGYRPFEGETPGALAVEIAANRVRPPPRHTLVPRRIHQILLKGLRADPNERFKTMRALLLQLGRRRSAQQQRMVLVSAILVLGLAVGSFGLLVHRERQRCAGIEQRLAGVWDADMRKKAHAAFLATNKPWAKKAWEESSRRLDAYATEWVALRHEVCMQQRGGDEAMGEQIVCLGRRLSDLEAVGQLFTQADAPVVERAVVSASGLTELSSCTQAPPTRARPKFDDDEPLRAQLAQVRARVDAARFDEARTQLEAISRKAESNGDHRALGEARLLEARLKVLKHDAKAAAALAEEAVLLAEGEEDDNLAARAWLERLGAAAMGGADPEEGDRWVRHATVYVERLGRPVSLLALLENNAGLLALRRDRNDEARDRLEHAVNLRKALLGPTHPLVARTLVNLGAAYKERREYDRAVEVQREALAIEEVVLDPTHPDVAQTLNNLGGTLTLARDFEGARAAFERALAIKRQAFGEKSQTVAITLTNLGIVQIKAGLFDEARETLEKSLRVKRELSEGDSVSIATTLTNLAIVYRLLERWDDAERADQEALGIRKAKQGLNHEDLALNYQGLGKTALGRGERDKARFQLERALSLQPELSVTRAETLVSLAEALADDPAERERALDLLNRGLPSLEAGSTAKAQAEELLQRLTKAPGPSRRARDR